MSYLKNAPKPLIELFEKRLRTDWSVSPVDGSFVPLIEHRPPRKNKIPVGQLELLEDLLGNRRMASAWNTIKKSLRSEDDYKKLVPAIMESMRLARRGLVSQTTRSQQYEEIAKRSEKLARLISQPPGQLGTYTGDLDLEAYEFLPQEVAVHLGARSWVTMRSDERYDWAHFILAAWPTMVDLLKELATRARLQGSRHVLSGRKSRSSGGTEGLEEKTTRKTKARFFACHLFDHFRKIDKRFSGYSALRSIVFITYGIDVDHSTMWKWIADHSKKTTT
jgi:hypothetical protein